MCGEVGITVEGETGASLEGGAEGSEMGGERGVVSNPKFIPSTLI